MSVSSAACPEQVHLDNNNDVINCPSVDTPTFGDVTKAITDLLAKRDVAHGHQRPRLCLACGNDDMDNLLFFVEDQSEPGDKTTVRCNRCNNIVFAGCRDADRAKFRRIYDFKQQLRPGDQVAWHRGVGCCCWTDHFCTVWHHAIVVEKVVNNEQECRLSVVHYNTDDKRGCCNLKQVTRRVDTGVDMILGRDDVYIVDYPESFSNEYAVERALWCARTNSRQYNFFTQNCEHFAGWAKTGSNDSNQTRSMICRLMISNLITLVLRFLAICGLLLVELLIPDNDADCSKSEIWLSCVFSVLYSAVLGAFYTVHQCRRRAGTWVDVGLNRMCSRNDRLKRYYCANSCGLLTSNIIETIFAWILPLIAASFFQWHMTNDRNPLVYLYVFLLLLILFPVGYVIGVYVGRGAEQCLDITCKTRFPPGRDFV